ncbi:MAG TPA: ABC transporter ATP-binding protein [Chloroflexota bacterium]|nr:ABC transporter ATP-binding protein [Chloroflexota bacterium]
MRSAPIAELQGVSRLYGSVLALHAVSLQVHAGETVVLLGPNGSGKTTLLKVLAGVVAPTAGTGHVLGRDLREPRNGGPGGLGLLAAESYLYDDLTARENLAFALTIAGRKPLPATLGSLLESVGLAAHGNERVRRFSSGMRRRLALARVLSLDPRLLLLDEPYNSLDVEAADLVDNAVRRVTASGGASVLATHDAARAIPLADRIARMDAGRLTGIEQVNNNGCDKLLDRASSGRSS